MTTRRQTFALALGVLAAPSIAQAQAWRPSRPLRLVVPFAPGGSNDIVSRIISESVGNALGQPVIIENRAGAGSVIGSEFVARAPADGHTLLINSAHSTVPAIVARVPYNAVTDFAGVAVAGFSPHVLVTSARLPVNNARELLALLRANPGRYNQATAGIGSSTHVAAELLRATLQVQTELVHYRGGGPAVVALVAGESHFGTPTMASSLGQIRGGTVKGLAVLGDVRSAALPDVPTAAEAGMPGVVLEEFFPILAPAGTPPAALAALSAAFTAAITQNAGRMQELAGVTPRPGFDTPEVVMRVVREGVESYTRILRAAGVQAE